MRLCSAANWRVVPALHGDVFCVSHGILAKPGPRPDCTAALGRLIGNSRTCRKPCRRRHGEPSFLVSADCSTGGILFPSSHPRFPSLFSFPPLQPHLTLFTRRQGDCRTQSPPNWLVVLQARSHFVSCCSLVLANPQDYRIYPITHRSSFVIDKARSSTCSPNTLFSPPKLNTYTILNCKQLFYKQLMGFGHNFPQVFISKERFLRAFRGLAHRLCLAGASAA